MIRAGSRAVTTKRSSGKRGRRAGRGESPLGPGQVERPVGLMDEHRPAGGADQPGHGHPPAVRPQPVSALAAPHPIDRAAAIELRAALAQAEDRAVAQVEGERAGLARRRESAG